jgi:hypothetical protein
MIFLGNINGAWDLHRDIIVVYMIKKNGNKGRF